MGPWPVEDVERVLVMVQGFDPIGVAARDLQESLLLQLRHVGLDNSPAERIVTEHLRALQNHQIPEISRKLAMPIEELKTHIEIIRHLDPKPGSRFNPSQSQYVTPDVYVEKVDDEYVVWLNEDGLPQMRISPTYRRLLDKGADHGEETRAYVRDKFNAARWLIKSVQQRQNTIYKVARSIVNFQREFLDSGIEHLRPLVLRDVANDIGMHESTVSRVVTNKYMHTPQGVFEMNTSSTAASARRTEKASRRSPSSSASRRSSNRKIRGNPCRTRRSSASCSARASCSPGGPLRNTARS